MGDEQTKLHFRKIGVIGLGYVGLPLALLFLRKDFEVVGIDLDENRVKSLNNAISYIEDIDNNEIKNGLATGRFIVTSSYDLIPSLDAILICVPTPLTSYNTPDLSYVQNVAIKLFPLLKPYQLIVLESSTYPGTTKEVLRPILEKSGLRVGENLFLAYSPERIDPGNKDFKIEEVPKVISGVTEGCKNTIKELYKQVFADIVIASSTEVAEMSKLIENSFRYINISFINEISLLCDTLNINVWDTISLASSKPYGFMPFLPGAGVGGHCIPVDPIYLSWKAQQAGQKVEFIHLADRINRYMAKYIVQQVQKLLGSTNLENKDILVYGIAYKKDIADYRESPAIKIITDLIKQGANVKYHDPFIPSIMIRDIEYRSIDLTQAAIGNADCLIILTDHSTIPLELLVNNAKLIYDTKNVTESFKDRENIVCLGRG